NVCTDDQCNGLGTCVHPPNAAGCDDRLFCNGTDTCSAGSCSVHGGDPCTSQCNSLCTEATDSCFDPAGTTCNDGDACTGNDSCNGAGLCRGQIYTASFTIFSANDAVTVGQGSRGTPTQATAVGGNICAREIKMKLFSQVGGDVVALRSTPVAPTSGPPAILFQKSNVVAGRCATGGGWIKGLENASIALPPCDTSGTAPRLNECTLAVCRASNVRSLLQSLPVDLDLGSVGVGRAVSQRIPASGTLGTGRVVIDASKIQLANRATLTLVGGPSTTQVIVRVAGRLRLGRPASIVLEGLQPQQVLFLVDGTVYMHSYADVSGTFYSTENVTVGFSSHVAGALISDKSVTLGNFVRVDDLPFAGW
ncbi:MAG: hypothetical protein HY270_16040, partial [Deltaproteobacteria bacterium]|nr:hypothetical protein [Deltaproteobacteria bacterium]